MIEVQENGLVDARHLHSKLEIKTRFATWVERVIERCGFIEGKEFFSKMGKTTEQGGRPSVEYIFTVDSAKEACIVSDSKKSSQIRKYLIELSNQRQNLELVTVKEAAFAVKVINCLKYVENQIQAHELHKQTFISEHATSQYIYSEFAKHRAKIVGWDKEKINEAVKTYIKENIRYTDTKILKSNMQTQLSAINPAEAIRVAVLDMLYSKKTEIELAENFANLCRNLAKELDVIPEKHNSNNLYRESEKIDNVSILNLPKV